jgi:thiamine-monophosphate kinase
VGESAAGCKLLSLGARLVERRVELPESFSGPESLARVARRAVRRHLGPRPQLELGRWLGRQSRAAAIDVSDGLARDLSRLCQESGVGVELEAARIPLAEGFERLCHALGLDPLAAALGGGEDYVLLFTLPAGQKPPPGLGCKSIGQIHHHRTIWLNSSGKLEALHPLGWDHLRADG